MSERSERLPERLLIAAAAAAGACWAWRCLCVFPWLLWNELRLEPSFLLAHGQPLYPTLDGPVTTWIYGPLTPLLLLPATLAADSAGALVSAAAINLTIVVGTILLVCTVWPGINLTWSHRAAAALACLAVWPASSLQYIQADNAAIAFGWLASLLLLRTGPDQRGRRWLAAAFAVAAIGCKQIAGGIILAQLFWLVGREGRRAMLEHFLRTLICGAGGALATAAMFDPTGLWLNLFTIPAQLPWTDAPAQRLRELAPFLLIHLALPAAVLFGWRRTWLQDRGSPLTLAALCWLASLPLGLMAILKIGGTINSLHGLPYLLPPILLVACTRLPAHRIRSPIPWLTAAALGLFVARLWISPAPAWRPITTHLHEAEALMAQLPGEVWFPWHPVVTYYGEHRFDHVEDGLQVRRFANRPLPPACLRRHLPPRWSVIALLRRSANWGLALELAPPARQVSEFGHWTLYSWPSAPNATASPSRPSL